MPQVQLQRQHRNSARLWLGLRQRGYGLVGTGNYQRNTEAAVRDFQRRSRINPSGIVGPKTWNALLAGTYTASDIGVRHRPQVLPGSRDKRVVGQLRTYLLVISPYQGASGVEDWYGPRLQGMVRDFQRRAGIKASGIVGPRTWAALGRAVAVTGAFSC
ncbi:peptidoglycan-binding domain-containing protein [Actinokineospora globicatena]|uniref:peptidoglycan-binding domain-containing protein n=1 Tax=Actinokineospora globicatena TaxID=103729 RepID=UPI002554110B|nr:peptidoglycan-binding protein [Actinokineospora globicatena]